MMRTRLLLALLVVSIEVTPITADESPNQKLLIAYSSLRDEPLHPTVFFYEHDGDETGKIVGKIAPVNNRSDHHPSLSLDGKLCVFAAEVVSTVATIQCWDRDKEELLDLKMLNKSPNAQMAPSIGANSVICYEAWNRPGSPGRWDLLLFDLKKKSFIETENLNSPQFDERKGALSGDGRWLAFTTNKHTRERRTEIALYDRQMGQLVALPNLNSEFMDTEPSISHDGRLISFVTDRPGGGGARDIQVYDRDKSKLIAMPGLNSVGQEQSPSISPDGRYVAFVAERLEGAGERDIYVYDREKKKSLILPGLNSPRDEYDPCVIVLQSTDN